MWQSAYAYDFSAVAPSGQTLYYNIVGNNSVVVTSELGNLPYYSTYPVGNLTIPSTVVHNGQTYFVTGLQTWAFYNCTGLTSVTISNGISNLGDYVFYGCFNMTNITFPDGLTTIGNGAFFGCSGLSSVFIPSSVTNIGVSAFEECSNLTSVTISDSITVINHSTFCRCSSLSSITIPDNVTTIQNAAFAHCTNLTSITIGNSLNSIGESAFLNCSNLTEIISHANVAPVINGNSFNGVNPLTLIHVPCESLSSYVSNWSCFSNFTEANVFSFSATSADSTKGIVNTITVPTCQNPIAVFYAQPLAANVFNHWSDGNTDNPRSLVVTQDTSITAYFELSTNDTVHDTALVHDTIYLPYYVHDTTTVSDTLYVTVHDTIIAYVNVPVHDTVFAYIEVPVHDTIYLPQYIYDTLWLHDTVYIHDTIYITQEGVDGADALNAKVYSSNGQIVIEDASGNTVTLYDLNGHILATKQDKYAPMRFDAPVSGTYMIKIGNYPARKVVVIR